MAKQSSEEKVGPVQYLGQVRQEMRKVVWPTWSEVYKTTIIVMIMVALFGLFFFVVDWVLANLIQLIFSIAS